MRSFHKPAKQKKISVYLLLCYFAPFFRKIILKNIMAKNLVIVESPAKAKTIGGFLGNEFEVKSCYGHVRDLSKTEIGIDVANRFNPVYEIPADKAKLVQELKKASKDAELIWLATDEDREGEAISWHLAETLKLKPEKIRRIVFHEITKNAILDAVARPRSIDTNLVNAQQARRVLDRLVGYELSPVLWKKVRPALSAGRVQSVAVRLIVERENEIRNFTTTSFFRIAAQFMLQGSNISFRAEVPVRFPGIDEAESFLRQCIDADFTVSDTETKPARKSPSPPFTTSTLQQEASRKLGFSVAKTMMIAQQLYEEGKITYMRTDSVNLSATALGMAKKEIEKLFGNDYVKTRNYTTKSKGAQEAHEAIRPTYLNKQNVDGTSDQQKLYELIWKRSIASQMADALFEKTNVTIASEKTKENFQASGEVMKFDGFLKVYIESTDDEDDELQKGALPPVKKGDNLTAIEISATERFTLQPPRYNEASLVKKLEELGIGRPSTYAPIISTIQKREYVINESRDGSQRNYAQLILKNGKLERSEKTETVGYEKSKLFPTDIGILVNNFLVENFSGILDYNFTASVEKNFDEIADGKLEWQDMISGFYTPFHEQVSETLKTSRKVSGERLLGTDPQSGKNVYVKLGRFGPMIQIGEATDEEKPRFASLLKGQSIETVGLEDALALFSLPRNLGLHEGEEVVVSVGKFGPYVRFKGAFYSLGKNQSPLTISMDEALLLVREKDEKATKKVIREFPENEAVKILRGRWGAYITNGKKNYRIPKGTKAEDLNLEDCLKIAEAEDSKPASDKKPKPVRGSRSKK
jgi:DNA topoisomerase I